MEGLGPVQMGGVLSNIAKGLICNIERDCIKQISPPRDKPKVKGPVKQDDKLLKKTSSLSDLRIIGTPVNQLNSVSKRSKVGQVSASSYSGQTDAEDFFQDFLSSLETTCLIQEHKCSGKENHSSSETIETYLEEGPKDPIFPDYEDYEDSLLPIINLLPRLTEDLAAQQRRPNPAWFKKSYTNMSTVQKIYLPKPKCTPIRR